MKQSLAASSAVAHRASTFQKRWSSGTAWNGMAAGRLFFCLALIFLLSYPLSAFCQQDEFFRVSPGAGDRAKAIKKVGVLFVDVKIHEILASGVREVRAQWTDAARQNLRTALEGELMGRSIQVKVLGDENASEEMDDVQILYRAVRDAVLIHSFDFYQGLYYFPAKGSFFDYSIGPLNDLLARLELDGLLFVSAYDYISSGGRKALMIVGAFAGVHYFPGNMWANMALVDRSGSVLWFGRSNFTYDLREAGETSNMVEWIFNEFPVPRQ